VSFSSLKSGQAVQARSQETVKILGFAVDICYDGVIKNVEWSEVKNQGSPRIMMLSWNLMNTSR
jgi:hypothetical protein